jgi:sensor histidine kinase regulating citrate/malate metabolism
LALQPRSRNQFALIARIYLALWILWGLSAIIRLAFTDMNLHINVEYRLVYAFTLISISFFGIFVYAVRIKDMQKQEHIMTVKSEYLLQNYEQTKFRVQEMNILKHELRNHLTVLNLFLKDEQYEEAQNYLDKYAHDVAEIIDFTHHENYLINVIAHDLLHRAKASDIKTELKLKAIPANIAELDLCSLLCNIVDNALEACAKMPKGQERLINLCITRREPYFVISCKNSNPGEITTEGNFFATKKTQNGHGYGLKIIERIVNSYDGIMSIDYDEDSFIIKVALKDEKNRN